MANSRNDSMVSFSWIGERVYDPSTLLATTLRQQVHYTTFQSWELRLHFYGSLSGLPWYQMTGSSKHNWRPMSDKQWESFKSKTQSPGIMVLSQDNGLTRAGHSVRGQLSNFHIRTPFPEENGIVKLFSFFWNKNLTLWLRLGSKLEQSSCSRCIST